MKKAIFEIITWSAQGWYIPRVMQLMRMMAMLTRSNHVFEKCIEACMVGDEWMDGWMDG